MIAIFCASKYSIVNRWKSLLVCKDTYVAKNQKDLLEKVTDDSFLSIVFIEERLYGAKTPELLKLIKTTCTNARLLVLSHMPSFHGGQAMLGFGAHGYGNVYMAKEWLNDAFNTLLEGENWIFPLQETPIKYEQKVGKVEKLNGKLVDENSNPVEDHKILEANQKLLLLEGTASILFDCGSTVFLQGREPICLDESVFKVHSKSEPLSISASNTPLKELEKPFYVNVGKESLVDATSDELIVEGVEYEGIYPFVVEETAKISLDFGEKSLETLNLSGNMEEYELIHSSSLSCVLINDTIQNRDGSHVVYEPIKTISFSNATVDLSGVPEREGSQFSFGLYLDWEAVPFHTIEHASLKIKGNRQAKDYILFDRHCVPESMRFNYSLDEKDLLIYFYGEDTKEVYTNLLKTLKYECAHGSSPTSIHAKLILQHKENNHVLFDGLIDTLSNTMKKVL